MARIAEVVHVETSTDTGRRMKVGIHMVLAEDFELIYGDYPLAKDIPAEVREALLNWLEKADG